MSCPAAIPTASLNPFKDPNLSDGAVRTFGFISELDRGPRGCFARRETLAKMRGVSVSAINHQIAELKQQGYIQVTTKGRQPGEPGIIRVSDAARNALTACLQNPASLQDSANKGLQQDASLQDSANNPIIIKEVHECCFKDLETTTDSGVQDNSAEDKPVENAVVFPESVKPVSENPHPEPQTQAVVTALVSAGVDPAQARQLAQEHPRVRCLAAVSYVQNKGKGVQNPGGYIRYLLDTHAQIPQRYFQTPEPSSKPRKSPGISIPEPAQIKSDPERDRRRASAPHRDLWNGIAESLRKKIQPVSHETWIAPLFIASKTEGEVVLDAPDAFFAEFVTEHYLWLLKSAFESVDPAIKTVRIVAA